MQWVDCNGQTRALLTPSVRHHALADLDRFGEYEAAAAAHANEIARVIAHRFAAGFGAATARSGYDIADLRAALEWSLAHNKFEMCADLLDHTDRMWIALSLVDEYTGWVRAALTRSETSDVRQIRDEMRLLATLRARAAPAARRERAGAGNVAARFRTREDLRRYVVSAARVVFDGVSRARSRRDCAQQPVSPIYARIAADAGNAAAQLNATRLGGILRGYSADIAGAIVVLTPAVDGS